MAIKKRTTIISNQNAIENLANELADKPYGELKQHNSIVRTTISLPSSVLFTLEDMAKTNKRNKHKLRSVSAIIRDCIDKAINLT